MQMSFRVGGRTQANPHAPGTSLPRRTSPPGRGEVVHAFGLAASLPEGLQRKGARAPKHCDPVATNGAALQRPRRLLPCRGCGHIVSGLIGPALARFGRASRVQDLELLRASLKERRCATGVRAGCCHACTASIRGPGIRGELPRVKRPRRYGRCLIRVTAPAPQSRSAARPMWTGVRAVWGAWGGGDNKTWCLTLWVWHPNNRRCPRCQTRRVRHRARTCGGRGWREPL